MTFFIVRDYKNSDSMDAAICSSGSVAQAKSPSDSMSSSSHTPCMEDFSSFVNAEFDRYRKASEQAMSEMLEHSIDVSRITEKVVLTDSDNKLPENRVDPQQERSGFAARKAIEECNKNTPMWSTYSAEEDNETAHFKRLFKCFQIESVKMMRKALEDAELKAQATAQIEVTSMRWRDESELLSLGEELKGPTGKRVMKDKKLLPIKDFLMKELPKNRRCCRTHFSKCFAKELKDQMKHHCRITGGQKYLKRTNHCLGFAYMEEDRPFMRQVLKDLIQDRALDNHHEKHIEKDAKKQLQGFISSEDEMEE